MWVNPKQHKTVGTHLENFRRKAGLTQTELAKRLRKPQSFVSAYEAGQRRIDLLELVNISAALGVDAKKVSAAIIADLAPGRTGAKS